jgi:hypothetical protein
MLHCNWESERETYTAKPPSLPNIRPAWVMALTVLGKPVQLARVFRRPAKL